VITQYQGRCAAIDPDAGVSGVVFGGHIGTNKYTYCKYDINGDSYSYVDLALTYKTFTFCADRLKLWYYDDNDYQQGYLLASDESNNNDIFPVNTERDFTGMTHGFYGIDACIWQAKLNSPRVMSYSGNGMWELNELTLTEYNMMIIDKPDDGFAVTAIEETLKRNLPFYAYDTITLPAGTWTFYYPKNGDYTQIVLLNAAVE